MRTGGLGGRRCNDTRTYERPTLTTVGSFRKTGLGFARGRESWWSRSARCSSPSAPWSRAWAVPQGHGSAGAAHGAGRRVRSRGSGAVPGRAAGVGGRGHPCWSSRTSGSATNRGAPSCAA
ncbi:keywimysin-related RiPP [Streptomyces sp. NPDC002838]|uniref:keywimysin-related RiPP n=1 Tax=Streptomyces sp. NPDC002838 TaxID=3154436 RepID=UPI003328F100